MAGKVMESYSLAVREGFRNFRRSRTFSFAMMGCIAVAVFAIGTFELFALNINSLLKRWESRVELVAFLSHAIKEQEAEVVLHKILSVPEVGEARLVTGRESWEKLFSDVRGSLDLREVPIEEVLPAAVVIKLARTKRDLADIRQIASRIASLDGVDDVKFEEMLLEQYMRLRRDLGILTAVASIFWTLVFGIITVNIARLASAARRNEIDTIRMLGASTRFVRRVFTVEGVAQGVAGSIIGIGMLAGTVVLLSSRMGNTLQLSVRLFAAVSVVGPVLGILASWFLFRNVLVVIVTILIIAVPGRILAQPGGSVESELIEYQHELTRLESELQQSRESAQKILQQESHIIDELEEVEKAIDSLAQQIKEGESKIAANKKAILKTQSELKRCEEEFEKSGSELERWLKLLCNRREPTMVEVVLYDIPQSEMTLRRELIALLARKQTETLMRTERLRANVLSQQEALRKHLELDLLHTETARLRAQQSIEIKSRREALLTKLGEQKSIYAAAIKDLEVSARRLQEMIETQQRERQSVFADSAPFREMKGLLPWPAEGEITVPFGRMRNPDSLTYTRHAGIDIAADTGTEVRAVHDAFVAYCDWFRGYGKLVILDHGDGYNSIYAHCSEIFVQKNDLVRASQPIALVGETGSLTGPFLYFEIRENGQPIDPAVWLQRRSIHATQSE